MVDLSYGIKQPCMVLGSFHLKCRRDARKIYIISKTKNGNNPFKNGLIKLTYRHADRHMVTSGMQSFEEFLYNMKKGVAHTKALMKYSK